MTRPPYCGPLARCRAGIVAALLLLSTAAAAAPVRVDISGLDGELLRNVRTYLSILGVDADQLPPARLNYLHGRAEREIQRALEPFGYYAVTVEGELHSDADGTRARYRVTLGPRVTIARVELRISGDGEQDPAFRAAQLEPGIAVGEPLLHRRYERLKQRLQHIAAERGFYDAHLERQQLRIDRTQHRAEILIHYATGTRYRYGELHFSDTPLSPTFIRRFVTLRPGDPLLTSELTLLQTRLANSDYFQRVEVRPRWSERAAPLVPIDVELEMRKRTRYRAGVGYDTDTGGRLTAGITRRWVNRKGHNFDALLQPGEFRTDASFQYNIPGGRPEYEQYSLRAAYRREQVDPIDAETLASGGSWQTRVGDWVQVIGLDIERENFDFEEQRQTSRFLFPRIGWRRTDADHRINVSRGYRVNLELLGASDAWYSDTSFVQGRLELKGVLSPTPGWRLLGRAELGGTVIEQAEQLPASKRFFAGGDKSVRGYAYKSLAPLNSSGNVEGGQGLIVAGLETDYRVAENWRAALFVDHGAAINSLTSTLKTGVGVGARWLSPIGPVRIDLAWALDREGTPWRLHFSIGPDL